MSSKDTMAEGRQQVSLDELHIGFQEKVDEALVDEALKLRDEIAENAVERDLQRNFPFEAMEALSESRLAKLYIPEELGGEGFSYHDFAVSMMLLAEGDPNVAQMFGLHVAGNMLLRSYADEETAEKWSRKIAEEDLRLTNSWSERGGDDVLDFQVTISPDDDGTWRLNGTKYYCTGSPGADLSFGPAVNPEDEEIYIFIADMSHPSIELGGMDDWSVIGQRTTGSGSVTFNDTPVPDEFVWSGETDWNPDGEIPEDSPWEGYEDRAGRNPHILLAFQMLHPATYTGIARAALKDATEYVNKQKRPWYQSYADQASKDPFVLESVGRMYSDVHAAESMLMRAADLCESIYENESDFEKRVRTPPELSAAKDTATRNALSVTEQLFEVCGTAATQRKYDYSRHWRNVRTLSLHDPESYLRRDIGDWAVNQDLPPVSPYK